MKSGEVYNNCKYEAYYDKGMGILHVLDAMGKESRMSVTNGIDFLYSHILSDMGIVRPEKVYLYGTDLEVFEFDIDTKDFKRVSVLKGVYKGYVAKQRELYG